ncbi:hypothetical protein [Variovorax paradoxus]|uniref:hypothetical protein n=1 Tax=Variovorax paradoxus TaxID=34073 RepID=UPI0024817459|nr:hypothetical protein [Variovorax paradoxus]WGT64771.1 hypothetical protein QHG62_05370 [Variovorax paradoxus]
MNANTHSRRAATAVTEAVTAVTKPRTSTPDKARAPIENEPQAPLVAISDIRRWMVEADRQLEMAFDAAGSGEYIEKLLDHICHSVMVAPLHTIQREDLTQEDAGRLYESLFVPMACIHAAVKLAEGTILQHPLEGAFELLDASLEALDPVNDAVKALPLQEGQTDEEKSALFQASRIEDNSYCMAGEVIAIIRARLHAVDSELLYGALRVVEYAHNELGAGVYARDLEMCEDASAPFASAIAVLEVTLREHDDVALHGALRLLELAKTSLDDAIVGVN